MSADYFLDTNVLVYSFDDREPTKRDTAQKLIAKALRQGCGVISWQVVQEFLNVALHKWEVPMTTGDATAYLSGTLEPLCSVFPTAKLWHTALSLQEQNQYRFCDSLDRTRFTTAHEGTMYVQDMFPDLPGSAIRADTFPYGPCWGILDPGMTMEKNTGTPFPSSTSSPKAGAPCSSARKPFPWKRAWRSTSPATWTTKSPMPPPSSNPSSGPPSA